jgi:peptidoglycan/xylan/chitin deacetylase (PgdA/CDA1 family)
VTPDERRSARLLLGAGAPDVAAVRRAVRAPRRPPLLDRLFMKAGLLSYERTVVRPQETARRAVLGEAAAGPPRFLVRVDEYPHYLALDEPAHYGDHAFERFHAVMAGAGVPYLLAALPSLAASPLDPGAAGGRVLSEREGRTLAQLAGAGVTLALHGYDHRTRARDPRRHSELAGLPEPALRARLDAGEQALAEHGIARPRVFVAPFNRFEARQYPVLAERYDVVCGGPETVRTLGLVPTPQWRGEAVYLPAYPPRYGTAAEVLPAARALIERRLALWVPVVLHWGWEEDRGLADLRALAAVLAPHAAVWDAFLEAVEASR